MKNIALVAVLLIVPLFLSCDGSGRDISSTNNEDWQSTILPKAPADITRRIQEYRTKEVTLVFKDSSGRPLAADQDVKIAMMRHTFLFGCNIFQWAGFNGDAAMQQKYREHFAALLNYATLPFYWNWYEPSPGITDQATRSRDMAEWCRKNHIRPKGHPLVWQQAIANWAQNMNQEEFVARLQKRVKDIVGGFAEEIDTFDVINESLAAPDFTNPLGYWVKNIGPAEAARQSLSWAREANPSAYLLINDYNSSMNYVTEVAALISQGCIPNAVGIQSHMHQGTWSDTRIRDTCERFKNLGVPIHFTETTILSGQLMPAANSDWETTRANWKTTPKGEEYQAKEVCRLYRLLFSHLAVEAITWWDFCDYGSWMGAPSGLLRKDLTHKPAYNVLMKLIHDEWRTRVSGKTDGQGRVTFRGFFGHYRLTVNGKMIEFDLMKNSPDVIEISVKI
jgi:GH35 family endo-1,4-beta-xylanase